MKKVCVLLLVLAFATAAQAVTVSWRVDPADAKTSYDPSDQITIQLYADEVDIQQIDISGVGDGSAGGYAYAVGSVASGFDGFHDDGYLVNSGDCMIQWFSGAIGTSNLTGVGGVLYSFDYHVPTVDGSTYITIGSGPDGDDYTWEDIIVYSTKEYINSSPLEIHVTPEPMTMGLLAIGGLVALRRRRA